MHTSLGGFAVQFAKFIPRTFLPDAATDRRKRVFTSEVTFWAWMSQILGYHSSCSHAVSSVQSWRLKAKLPAISSKTTAYCNARLRLPLAYIDTVSKQVLSVLNHRVRTGDLWHGLIVKSVDGSSTQLMDTGENQKEFPQPTNQKKHCGFPVMKFLGLLNHCTGAWGKHLTAHPDEHDARTMKKLISHLSERCLLLADRAFCSFEIILRLRNQGVESVMRLHQMRAKGFTLRKGKRIGPYERLVTWVKPGKKPSHSDLSDEEWDALADTIQMRLIACFYEDRNGEKKRMVLATTLLDARKYDWIEIMNLYANFLETAATKLIDHRPYRWEPRAIKKRPKPFPRLTESRSSLKEKREAGDLIPA